MKTFFILSLLIILSLSFVQGQSSYSSNIPTTPGCYDSDRTYFDNGVGYSSGPSTRDIYHSSYGTAGATLLVSSPGQYEVYI